MMKQEGDDYEICLHRGETKRKKGGRKKIAAKFGDKIADRNVSRVHPDIYIYIKRKTVAWVFAKREVGRDFPVTNVPVALLSTGKKRKKKK